MRLKELVSRRRRELVFTLPLLAGAGLSACERRRLATGTVVVGSSATGVPFSFVDPWTNELTGFMVDVMRQVATQAGLTIELQVIPFSALIPSLRVNKIDIIAAAMLRTAQREKIVAFSNQVFTYGGGLVVRKDNPASYRDLQALRRLRVGAQVGTRFIDQAIAAGIENVPTYDNLSDMLRDLSHGRIDAAYGDAPILTYQLKAGTRPNLRMVREFVSPGQEECCLILRQEDPRMSAINGAIDVLRPRLIPSIAQHWGLV